MRVCGVICEYDPFHNGHAYHLERARALSRCDYVVCVMSGSFTQRGHAAIVSKWSRAEMALHGGADAVFELPTLFAVRDAERFARGGVSLLSSLGVVTHLAFGCESGDLKSLSKVAAMAEDKPAIREGLSTGQTLARARGDALGFSKNAPNDTLAIEYLRSLAIFAPGIEPVAVRREGSGYHDASLGAMASATAIRAAIRRGEDITSAMPKPAFALLSSLLSDGAYQREDGLDIALLSCLRTITPEALAEIADVGEGLENRLLRAAQPATSRESLLARVKCKRYTHARLSRILTQTLLGITKSLAERYPLPSYARLLGFRESARPLMAEITRHAAVPIIMRAAPFLRQKDESIALDIRAADLWALGCASEMARAGHQDLTERIRILSN